LIKGYQRALVRIVILAVVLSGVGMFVLWDYGRITRNFSGLKALLRDTRQRAIRKNEVLTVRFNDKKAVVTDRKTGEIVNAFYVSSLNEVNYDTTLGDDMIVFSRSGTEEYNKQEHGRDLSDHLISCAYLNRTCCGLGIKRLEF